MPRKERVLNEDIEDQHLSVYFSFLLLGLFNVIKLKQNGFIALGSGEEKKSKRLEATMTLQNYR
jgi:hypothetical protein